MTTTIWTRSSSSAATRISFFHYSRREGRYIATDEDWRNKYLVVSSLGRVHVDALSHFEAAEHYLKNTYVRVSLQNPVTGLVSEGSVLLLDELLEKSATYVPRFQSNQEYISHHTFGTAIDVNDTMVPNKNRPENHEVIGDDVKNHLIYNGIRTDENGVLYYDFLYTGSYSGRYKRVPKTIINYLLYELAFFRAGFEWGYYYETTCDAMHFMLTENDINRHMHTDIGLRKVYEYAEPSGRMCRLKRPRRTVRPGRTPRPSRTIRLKACRRIDG